MGGLTAFLSLQKANREVGKSSHEDIEKTIDSSLDIVQHRGPDTRGKWVSQDQRVGFGQVQLPIVDLTPGGHQPFHDSRDQIHAVVNGELYGYEGYRAALAGEYEFKGHSDCEIVIALYQQYGISFLSHLRGEFALILWDARRELFFAARDRYGVKSLYHTFVNGRLLVATEMKSFLAFGWQPEWCVRNIRDRSWNHDSETYFNGVYKVKPGHYLISRDFGRVDQRQYWDLDYPDMTKLETRSEAEMIEGVRERLLEAVRSRLRADAPVGISLSGGLDSSAVAGMVAHLVRNEGVKLGNSADGKDTRIECFTVQFDQDSGANESDIAQRTAEWLGVECHPVAIDEAAMASRLEDVVWHSEAPVADVNATGRLAMGEMARSRGIKVILTGEGADEHFAGYAELRADSLLEPDYSWPPSFFPERAATSQSMAARQSGLSHFASGNDDTPESARRMLNFTKFPALVRSAAQLPFSPWVDHNMKTTPGEALAEHIYGRTQGAVTSKWHPLHTSLYTWIKTLFPSFLLRYVGDNIDAAHQIESRPAFLDHRLTEYANGLPPSLKMKYNPQAREFNEKYILREAVKPFVPEELYRRRKHPFLGPSRFQENGPLHQWVKALLTPENVDALGFLDWNQLSALLDKAFKERDPIALRPALLSAQFVVLSQRFHVPKAQPENVMDAGV